MGAAEKTCSTWKTWAEVFGFSEHGEYMVGYQAEIVQYVAYALIAVCSNRRVCVLLNLISAPLATIGVGLMYADNILDSVNILRNTERVWRALAQLPRQRQQEYTPGR